MGHCVLGKEGEESFCVALVDCLNESSNRAGERGIAHRAKLLMVLGGQPVYSLSFAHTPADAREVRLPKSIMQLSRRRSGAYLRCLLAERRIPKRASPTLTVTVVTSLRRSIVMLLSHSCRASRDHPQ